MSSNGVLSPSSSTPSPPSLDRGVALTSLSVRQLMSYSPSKKKSTRERGAWKERNERGGGQRELRKWTDRDFLSVRVSYRLPAGSLTRISYVPFHPSFLLLAVMPRSLASNTFFLRYFSLYFCRFSLWHSPKCIRSVGSVVDKSAINGFYSVSNWKSIGCRRCHKRFREIGMYRWSIRVRFVSHWSERESIIAETRYSLIISMHTDVWKLFLTCLNV